MSLPQGSGNDLNLNPSSPHHHQHLNPTPDGIIDGDLPPDPLLQSGAFIDATTTTTSNSQNPMETGKARSNGVESTSVSSGVTADGSAGRVKPKGSEPQAMDWLPAGWTVEYKVRSSGATAGSTDRYYHDPVSGRRFRSKKEVLHFLETGMIKKNANSEKTSVEGSASKKQKKSGKKSRTAVNFDFLMCLRRWNGFSQTPLIGPGHPLLVTKRCLNPLHKNGRLHSQFSPSSKVAELNEDTLIHHPAS